MTQRHNARMGAAGWLALLLVICAGLIGLLHGCTSAESETPFRQTHAPNRPFDADPVVPRNAALLVGPFQYNQASIVEFTTEGGVPCVALIGYDKAALSCRWEK